MFVWILGNGLYVQQFLFSDDEKKPLLLYMVTCYHFFLIIWASLHLSWSEGSEMLKHYWALYLCKAPADIYMLCWSLVFVVNIFVFNIFVHVVS